jgi:hypothetical protein
VGHDNVTSAPRLAIRSVGAVVVAAGHGVGLIDPHGDLAEELLDCIPPVSRGRSRPRQNETKDSSTREIQHCLPDNLSRLVDERSLGGRWRQSLRTADWRRVAG